ncbi:MAG: hypothetical protein Q8Q08_01300 [Candidatus Omnitrophota bacterium]|nr:hypothetical protein [Candidatus Omnitrophota bacterium]MDZ4243377.1 hypothetical protein [Candidatus Omnitrophota bacterium]
MRILVDISAVWASSNAIVEDIRDVKAPVDVPHSYFWMMLMYFILFTLIAAPLAMFFVDWIRKASQRQAPRVAAWDAALERLGRLRQDNLPSQGLAKDYYTRLSDIVRRYVEERFQIHAPEMTTQEFLSRLGESGSLSADHKGLLRDFLGRCDKVKFAKYGSNPEEMEASFDSAKRLVEETRVNPKEHFVK